MDMFKEAEERRKSLVKAINEWAAENLRDFPWRKDPTPFKVLVAEFLLKRTTSSAVKKVYDEFIREYPSIDALANTSIYKLESLLQTLGYQIQRSKRIKETCTFILDKHNGEIPKDNVSLIKIPNIGPYTAGAILSLGFGIRAPMVDSNVERIFRRLFFYQLPQKSAKRMIENVADNMVPETGHQKFNLALIDLGATVCTYRKPHHDKCPLKDICDLYNDDMKR